ncbi:dTDP-4-dehydrorhamnose reductase [Legionella cardiaca]|uniref:dTDP-4-dehydrorhamnose reductase n=1 Tax=Legionella cardiaca TaxID=1071983 RepID=A0ABY8AMP7_9GAMM|nr:dTDP-4-dehydrorhamnose reductase [Legionella cardiaca]WED41912.1 dTDP-4-dehydrorhamnose reductase [Legionella cardiaca]
MKILLLGSTGQVGSELIAWFANSKHEILSLSRKECDLLDPQKVFPALAQFEVDLVVNAAAYTAVDRAEDEVELAKQINGYSIKEVANYCQSRNIPLIHFSTDYVFDGLKSEGYTEEDLTNPKSAYGHSKLLGEQLIQAHLGKHLILRVSWVFSKNRQNFVKTILRLANTREELGIVADQWGRPTAAKDIARVIDTIIQKLDAGGFNNWGIYHYASQGPTNWYEFATSFLKVAKDRGYPLLLNRLQAIKTEEYPTKAQRPKNSVLITNKIEKIFNIECAHWDNYLLEVIDQSMQEEIRRP